MDTQIKNKSAKITYANGDATQTVDLYSQEGLDLIGLLWTKLYAQYKLHYESKWMGIPIIQFAGDILMMQELIWKVKPDVIIECGIAHGGSLIFYASLFELMGQGKVIGVDIDIREHNRIAIENHLTAACKKCSSRRMVPSPTDRDGIITCASYIERSVGQDEIPFHIECAAQLKGI